VILTSHPSPPVIPIIVTLGPQVPDNDMCIQLAGKIKNNNYRHETITSSDLRSWHSSPKWQALSKTSCNNVVSTNNGYWAPCPNNFIANTWMISSNPYHPLRPKWELLTHGWGNHEWLMETRRWWWWRWSPPNPHADRVPERSFWFRIVVSGGGGAAELYIEKTPNPRCFQVRR
jgi:hypothetical protein